MLNSQMLLVHTNIFKTGHFRFHIFIHNLLLKEFNTAVQKIKTSTHRKSVCIKLQLSHLIYLCRLCFFNMHYFTGATTFPSRQKQKIDHGIAATALIDWGNIFTAISNWIDANGSV